MKSYLVEYLVIILSISVTALCQTTYNSSETEQPLERPRFYSSQCIVCDSYSSPLTCSPWDKYTHITNCSNVVGIDSTRPQTCRKIVQYIFNKRRVIRQCSNLDKDSLITCIDRVGTHKIRMRYCQCRGALCNQGTSLQPFFIFLLFVLTAVYLVED